MMKDNVLPYHGIRILEFSDKLAGSLTGQFLADQGADVISVTPIQRAVIQNSPTESAVQQKALLRNKRTVSLSLESEESRNDFELLVSQVDIIIVDFSASKAQRLGLDYDCLHKINPSLIYLMLPSFSITDTERKNLEVTEGYLAAYSGLFREISPVRDLLGLSPVYTPLPLPSVYAAVHGATAIGAALIARLQDGQGEFIEVPLFDAAMSALSGLLMKIEQQPLRYDVPPLSKNIQNKVIPVAAKFIKRLPSSTQEKIFSAAQSVMPPLFQNYKCSDGRFVFICALEHKVQTVNALKTFGVYDQLQLEGLKFGSPMDNSGATDNVMNIALLSVSWKGRIKKLISSAALTKTAQEWETLLEENKVPAGLVRSSDEWLDIPLLNEKGLFVDIPQDNGDMIRQPGPLVAFDEKHPKDYMQCSRKVSINQLIVDWPDRVNSLQINDSFDRRAGLLSGKRVVDLANVIAGPTATRTLAELGAEVIKVDAPDPQIGPRMTMQFGLDCSQGKKAIVLDIKTPEGQELLNNLTEQSDLLVHNYLDKSAERLKISLPYLQRHNPKISAVQISAFGAPLKGGWEHRPAFDPVIQVISGITVRYGDIENPRLHAIASCIDYITGFSAAFASVTAMYESMINQKGVLARTSLCAATNYIQYPFNLRKQGEIVEEFSGGQTCLGKHITQRIFKTKSGWIYLESESSVQADLATELKTTNSEMAIERAIKQKTTEHWLTYFSDKNTWLCSPVNNFAELREKFALYADLDADIDNQNGSIKVLHYLHPSGYQVATMAPSWMRIRTAPVKRQRPAPSPGMDTRSLLQGMKISKEIIEQLYEKGIVRDSYIGVSEYLPS